jgi:hypothetical protein
MTALEEPKDINGQIEVSSEALLRKLRTAVQPPGKKGTWLRHLNDKRLLEVYFRLRRGQSALSVAGFSQKEWGVMRHSEVKSLARAVRVFRNKAIGLLKVAPLIGPEGTKKERRGATEVLGKRGKRITKDLDGLGRLRWAIDIQTDRVATLVEKEKQALPFKFTDKSIEVLTRMLESYMKIQVDLGLLESKPQELSLDVRHRFQGLMQHSMRGGGAGVTSAMGKFLEMAEEQALTFELDNEGQYVMRQEVDHDASPEIGKNYQFDLSSGDGGPDGKSDGAVEEGDETTRFDDRVSAQGGRTG